MASSGDRFRRQPSQGGTKGASSQPGGGVATPRQGVPANPVSRTEQAGLAHEGLRGEPTANLDQGGGTVGRPAGGTLEGMGLRAGGCRRRSRLDLDGRDGKLY